MLPHQLSDFTDTDALFKPQIEIVPEFELSLNVPGSSKVADIDFDLRGIELFDKKKTYFQIIKHNFIFRF